MSSISYITLKLLVIKKYNLKSNSKNKLRKLNSKIEKIVIKKYNNNINNFSDIKDSFVYNECLNHLPEHKEILSLIRDLKFIYTDNLFNSIKMISDKKALLNLAKLVLEIPENLILSDERNIGSYKLAIYAKVNVIDAFVEFCYLLTSLSDLGVTDKNEVLQKLDVKIIEEFKKFECELLEIRKEFIDISYLHEVSNEN